MAGALALGMTVLAVVMAVAVPTVTWVDLVVLAAAATAHGTVALTVGRRWQPGGMLNLAYVVVVTALVLLGIQQSLTPSSDAFWFLLVPVGLAAATLPWPKQVAVVVVSVVGYVGASSLGPGIDVAVVAGRSTALVVFGLALGALTGRLHAALREADAATAMLLADVEEMTSENLELHRLDSARDDYVSSVSHELRTPLTVILGMARTLDERWEELDDAARRQLAARTAASAQGLDGIVSALLDLARIERGGFDPVLAPVDVVAAVADTTDRLAPVLAQHEVVIAGASSAVARTDARLLDRVLDNLLTNAARHTPPGTTVTVVVTAPDEHVDVEVRDDGPGIPADDVARLGQQFFRGSDEAARSGEGLGLGLALVVEILRTLGDDLRVTSEVGHGTTFAFSLPGVDQRVLQR